MVILQRKDFLQYDLIDSLFIREPGAFCFKPRQKEHAFSMRKQVPFLRVHVPSLYLNVPSLMLPVLSATVHAPSATEHALFTMLNVLSIKKDVPFTALYVASAIEHALSKMLQVLSIKEHVYFIWERARSPFHLPTILHTSLTVVHLPFYLYSLPLNLLLCKDISMPLPFSFYVQGFLPRLLFR